MLKEVLQDEVNDSQRGLKTPGMKKSHRNGKPWVTKRLFFSTKVV